MIYLLITISIISIILILIFTIRVTIFFEYKINDISDISDNTIIKFSIFKGIIKYKLYPNKSANKKQEDENKKKSKSESIFDKINNIIKIYKTFEKMQIYLKEKMTLKKLEINLDLGTGDAFYTGIFIGLFWALTGIVVSYLFETFQKCENKININAKFSEKTINGLLCCIFTIKFVYIIVVVAKILLEKLLKKNKTKGGEISA